MHKGFSGEVGLDKVPPQIQGVRGIGFVRPEHRDIPPFERPQTEEFRLAPREIFAPFLILLNNSPEPKVFLVTAILDYRQTAFELDGQQGLLHEITVPPRTELEMPLRIDIGTLGMHDLQVVAFDDPYNVTLDLDYRMDLYGRVAARRAVVVVGDVEKPARTLESLDIGAPIPGEVTFRPWVAFAKEPAPDKPHPSQRQLYVDTARQGQMYAFQIWASNTGEQTAEYAVVPFFNYHQVPLAGQDVLVVHLEPGEETIIDADWVLPEEVGVHQLQLVWLFDPYHSVLRDEVLAPFVFGSPRIAICVN